MRRVGWALLTALAALFPCGPAAGRDLPDIRRNGTLRVLLWTENSPELYAASPPGNDRPGLEAEILAGFAALQRLKIEAVPVDSIEDRITALLVGRGDLVAGGMVNTERRRQLVDFTVETFPIRHVAMNRKPRAPVASLEQLRRERVGTLKGSSWADEVRLAGVPVANVDDRFGSSDELLTAMRAGTVTATVISGVRAAAEMSKDPDLQLGVLVGAPTSVGFALRKDQPLLRAKLDDYITNLRRTPSWSRLVLKYFGESGIDIIRRSRAQ